MGKIFSSILETVGHTPLVLINRMNAGGSATVLAKVEYFNPAQSTKDRVAVAMIDDAEARGVLKPGATIIEPTSGNTGIGLALVAAVRGYHLILTMPDTMSVERRRILTAYGAQVVLTPGAEGMAGSIKKAEELRDATPGSFIPQQFSNPANPAAHEKSTAEELWQDTDGRIDAVVAGVGTGGTLMGVARALKKRNPAIRAIAVEPASSPMLTKGISGAHKIQGIGANFIPDIICRELIDEVMTVDNDDAITTAKEAAVKEGLLVGISSGAALWAALECSKRPEFAGKTIVAILPDTGSRYLA